MAKLKCTKYLIESSKLIKYEELNNKTYTLMTIKYIDKNIYKCHYEVLSHPAVNYYKTDEFLSRGQISAMIIEKKIKPTDDVNIACIMLSL